jgi:4-alpha-glucanotransferase
MTARASGILLPLFSLRENKDLGFGNFGALPGLFDFLRASGQKIWMTLPLLPTAVGDASPYATRSAFGLNPLFLSVPWLPFPPTLSAAESALAEQAEAAPTIRYDLVFPLKAALLQRSFDLFSTQASFGDRAAFREFCEAHRPWLDDYALFEALAESFQQAPWWSWPVDFASRKPEALRQAAHSLNTRVSYFSYLQWQCEVQWRRVQAAARARDIELWGDEPFIVGRDSSDAWCHPTLLRSDGRLGVPPDEFSSEGQDWGLPYFDFEAMREEQFQWLKRRAERAAQLYNARRIDHAIGYFRQYVRDAAHPSGRFIPSGAGAQRTTGFQNFELLRQGSAIIAEDLGVIPRLASDALASFELRGYQVMRWAREDGLYRNPHRYPLHSLVTTGTHDTDSLCAWWRGEELPIKEKICRTWPEMKGRNANEAFEGEVHVSLLRAALHAQSDWCLLPWGDVFGESQRINTPGTVGPHNWSYRMARPISEMPPHHAKHLAHLTRASKR